LIDKGLKADNLILLAGERYVKTGLDGSEEELNNIALKYNLTNFTQVTETHLIETAYEESSLYHKLPTYIIDTPKGDLPRPTTHTTIIELNKWMKQHEDIKNIIFISNQPYVKYQKAIITWILKTEGSPLDIEVVGAASNKTEAHALIKELGSFIFAATPNILMESGEKVEDLKLLEDFKELYATQPLIYQNLEYIFLNQSHDIDVLGNAHHLDDGL
jgi:hypothetical protein